MGYGRKTFLQNFLEIAIQLSPIQLSQWLSPGRGKCGRRFPLTQFLSISISCSMKSLMKPGTAAPHGVPALQPLEGSKTSV